MVKTGMTRRIDELGRLVIPKEIRKNLKIKDNDQVEINVIDNKIILNKFESMDSDKIVRLVLITLKRMIKKNVLFTSREKIIDLFLCDKDIVELDDNIMNIIENRKDVNNIKIKNKIFSINPLIINGDLYGSLIIYGNKDIYENELEIINYCKLFLENYLE